MFAQIAVQILPNGRDVARVVASGIRCENKVCLAVWNLNGQRNVALKLPSLSVRSVRLGYPLNSDIGYEQKGDVLHLSFTKDWQAQIFEIEAEEEKNG